MPATAIAKTVSSNPKVPCTLWVQMHISSNNSASAGSHTITVIAENSNGSGQNHWNWSIYWTSESRPCIPSGTEIDFQFDWYQVDGGEWKQAYCNENAIARYGFGSEDKNQFSATLNRIKWKTNDSNCNGVENSFLGPDTINKELYLVTSLRNGHAMVAELRPESDKDMSKFEMLRLG